ncbi:hypothetical protein WA026_022352 [Henosepilachna vigintioctopunctata]|uniref:Uncharacterized protein n=1 Tax=Henosepilachna vigintioctopunctata TaxID=420089 RepID=A0AAW1V1S0_9CUCU
MRDNKDQKIKYLRDRLDVLLILSRYQKKFVNEYKKAKREYDVAIIKSKQDHYAEMIKQSSNQSKTVWKIVKNLRDQSSDKKSVTLPSGNIQNIVNKLNTLFVDASSKLTKKITKNKMWHQYEKS